MSFNRPCLWKLCTLYCFSGVNGVFFSKFRIITSTTDCVKNNNTGVLTFLILIHQMTQLIWYTCIYIHDGFIFLNKKLICRGVFHHLHLGTKHLSKSYQTLKKIMHLWSIVMLISNTRTVRNYIHVKIHQLNKFYFVKYKELMYIFQEYKFEWWKFRNSRKISELRRRACVASKRSSKC